MSSLKKFMTAAAGTAASSSYSPTTAIEDVFSINTFHIPSISDQTITTNVDLLNNGGMIWIKNRNTVATTSHFIYDTTMTSSSEGPLAINSHLAAPRTTVTFPSFSSSGWTIYGDGDLTPGGGELVSFTFRRSPRFFDVVRYTGDGSSSRNISHNLGVTPGMIMIKSINTAGTWMIWHKDLTNTTDYYLDTTDALEQGAGGTWPNGVTDQYFSVSAGTSNNHTNQGGTIYSAYIFAHDPLGIKNNDGLISCGSYSGNGNINDLNIGFEPDFLIVKAIKSGVVTTSDWWVLDQLRGISHDLTNYLKFTSASESKFTSPIEVQSKGVKFNFPGSINLSGTDYIYLAIRRGPMKVPTSGTEVLHSVTLSNQSAFSPIQTGFPPDLIYWDRRNTNITAQKNRIVDKVRGLVTSSVSPTNYIKSIFFHSDSGESSSDGDADFLRNELQMGPSPNWYGTFPNDGFRTGGAGLATGTPNIVHSFRRSPGFFDIVLYYGNSVPGRQIEHNLQVTPELIIVKNISQAGSSWRVYCPASLDGSGLTLNSSNGAYSSSSFVYNASDTTFTVGADVDVNGATTSRYIAYLFGSVSGVSKIGSYTGDNTNGRVIDCGFSNGARFVISKRTDGIQSWYLWDSTRGINSGDDPRLTLNQNVIEVQDTDSIDVHSSGFIVNSDGNLLNGPSYNYIFLAIA